MFDWLTTTTHHDLHHAQAGWNYGLYFTWWDRLMGTEHPDYHARFAAAVRKPLRSKAGNLRPAAIGMIAALAVIAFPGSVRAQTPASIAGDWATPGLGAVVRLTACADDARALCGRLVWVWDRNRVRPNSVGALMLRDAHWRDGAFRDGELHNPEDGRVYRGQITIESADALRLRGCAGPFCQTQVWRRLDSIPRPES